MIQREYGWKLSGCRNYSACVGAFVALFFFIGCARASTATLERSVQSDTDLLISKSNTLSHGSASASSLTQGTFIEIARRRQTRMMSLMEQAPGAALKLALPATLRNALPRPIRDYIEEPIKLSGTLEVLCWVAEDGRAGCEHYLASGKRRLMLFVEGLPDSYVNGTQVAVEGLRLNDRVAAGRSGMTLLEPADRPSKARPAPDGNVQYATGLVINVNFPTIPQEPWTVEAAANIFDNQVTPYFDGSSYDLYHFEADVTRWYTIDARTDTCQWGMYGDLAVLAAEEDGWNPSDYDHIVIAFPRVAACRWAGLGQVPGRFTWLNNAMRATTATHELGHNLGLSHSHSIRCSDGPMDGNCSRTEYGDRFDRMGSGPLVAFHGTYKVYLGWIPMSDMVEISPEDGERMVTINSVEQTSGPRVVRVLRPDTDEFFTIEMREPIGVDAPLSQYPYLLTGLPIYIGSSMRNQSIIDVAYKTATRDDAPLQIGDTLLDPESTLTITTVDVGNSQATIMVSYGK